METRVVLSIPNADFTLPTAPLPPAVVETPIANGDGAFVYRHGRAVVGMQDGGLLLANDFGNNLSVLNSTVPGTLPNFGSLS